MNKTNEQFTVNDLFSNAVLVFSDNEGKETFRISFLIVIVFGFFSGLIPLGILILAIRQWKVALVNKEAVLKESVEK